MNVFLYHLASHTHHEGLAMEKRPGRWKEPTKRLYLESRGPSISAAETRSILAGERTGMGPGGRCEPLTQSTPAVAVAVWVPDKGGSGLTPVPVFSPSHGGSNICQFPQAHHRVSQLPTQPPNRADESASSNSRTSPPRRGLEINLAM